MAISKTLEILKRREGLSLTAYPDFGSDLGKHCTNANIKLTNYQKLEHWNNYKGNPWTIGYGDTEGVFQNSVITEKEALDRLKRRVWEFEKEVVIFCGKYKFVPNDNQLTAMVCFAYNLGVDDLYEIMKHRSLDFTQYEHQHFFAREMLEYVRIRGVFSKAQSQRRWEEATLFLTPPKFD